MSHEDVKVVRAVGESFDRHNIDAALEESAMSPEGVEIVRRMSDAFNRDGLDGLLRDLHPEIEWTTTGAFLEAATYRGHEEVRRYVGSMLDEFESPRFVPEELIEVGDQAVISWRFSGQGKQSGAVVELTLTTVSSLRDGKLVRIRNYPDKAEALEAVGLREWENAEQRGLVEAGFGALNSGDLEAFLALTAEDVEFTSMVAEAEGTIFRGHDGVRAWWETVRGAFEEVRWELLDIRGSGDRGVLHFRMAGTLGSVPVEQTMWQATVLRDGQVIWWAFFRSEREAVEALELRK